MVWNYKSVSIKIHIDPLPLPQILWVVVDIRTGTRVGMSLYRTEKEVIDAIDIYRAKGSIYLASWLAPGTVLFDEDDDYVGYIAYL